MTNHDKQLFGRELQGRKTFDGFMFIFLFIMSTIFLIRSFRHKMVLMFFFLFAISLVAF